MIADVLPGPVEKGTAGNSAHGGTSTRGLKPYMGAWGQKQVMHLLRRCLFGFSFADYRFFSKMTLQQCLDVLLTPSAQPLPPVNVYNDDKYTDPAVPVGQTWIHAPLGTGGIEYYRLVNCKGWWFGLMLNQKGSLTEKMTLFWHDHFATEMMTVKDSRYSYNYLALLMSHALGNFKTLARGVTTDPHMLVYLNGNTNTANAPNENYGRELQELFTIGKGQGSHYTEDDVRAAAKVLTGWKDDKHSISAFFDPSAHDTSDKQFSAFYGNTVIKGLKGDSGAKETDQLIEMIFTRQETARFLCRNLYRWFIYYNIDDQVEKNIIVPLADELVKNNFEVAPVLRILLGSEHFFDTLNMGCQIKNPVDFIICLCKQFDVTLPPQSNLPLLYQTWSWLEEALLQLGMFIGDPPSVAGWPAYYQEPEYYQLWINSGTLSLRNKTSEMIFSEPGLEMRFVEKQGSKAWTARVDVLAFASRLPDPADASKLIDDSITFLLANDLGPEQKDYLKSFLLSGQMTDYYWRDAWKKYLANPDDKELRSIVESRLRSLYTYMTSMVEYYLM